jgi:hypothetical protein
MAHNNDDHFEEESGFEPTPAGLAHFLQEQYIGDDRFDTVELAEPGPLDDEDVRVKYICDNNSHFFVAVLSGEGLVRIGLATQSEAVCEAIEEAATDIGGSLTEFLQDALESEDELEHEVQHYHDDMDYFASEIPYQTSEDLASDILRDEIVYYLDGYMNGFYDYLGLT